MFSSENCSGKRIIRKEGDKVSELFSLIIRGTMEESCFKKSSKDLAHTEINEVELMDVLEGREINKQEKIQQKEQYLFTF